MHLVVDLLKKSQTCLHISANPIIIGINKKVGGEQVFRIGEFSKLTQVTIRMLRYYDHAGLLKPTKIDPWTGYRMYSAEQIPVLNKIIYFRDSGFSVSEIAQALGQDDAHAVVEQLDRKYEALESLIRGEMDKLDKIRLAKQEILSGRPDMHYNVVIKQVPACQVLSLRQQIPDYYGEGDLWRRISDFAEHQNIPISDDTFSIYHDKDYKEENVDVELCVPVKKMGTALPPFTYREVESVNHMASTTGIWRFFNIAGAYQALAGWLASNSRYKMTGQSRQIVHREPWNEERPEKYLTEIQIPLQKTA